VLVHQPGEELRAVTPDNRYELLFDETLWPAGARREHAVLTDTLAACGVCVVRLGELLREVVEQESHRDAVSEGLLGDRAVPASQAADLRRWMEDQSAADVACGLVAGIDGDGRLGGEGGPAGPDLLPPLPNAMFVRDSSMWVGAKVVLGSPQRAARQRERVLLDLVYRLHPLFAGTPVATRPEGRQATLEGGDLLVVDETTVIVGISERTSRSAVERLAERLFWGGECREVVAVALPHTRATMHLDTMLTLVGSDGALLHPAARRLPVAVLRPGRSAPEAYRHDDLAGVLTAALGPGPVRLRGGLDDDVELAREQWDDGFNVLAVDSGTVIAYECNELLNQQPRDAGLTVLTVPGSELRRARGGPRCLTCPIRREPRPERRSD
jgi:arginine deiminase